MSGEYGGGSKGDGRIKVTSTIARAVAGRALARAASEARAGLGALARAVAGLALARAASEALKPLARAAAAARASQSQSRNFSFVRIFHCRRPSCLL